jgi:hypothetical protein
MNRLHSTMSGILALGFFGFLSFGNAAFAEQISRQQILEALTAQPKVMSLADNVFSCHIHKIQSVVFA